MFRIRTVADGGSVWRALLDSVPSTTVYHGEKWLALLRHTYGCRLFVATLEDQANVLAGCVFVRSRFALRDRWVSLPFSDLCPPLAIEPSAMSALLSALAQRRRFGASYEVRGVMAPPPWRTVDCFQLWSLDMTRPRSVIEAAMRPAVRRKLRQARDAGVTISHGSSIGETARFYALQLEHRRRLGLPAQPKRMFEMLHELFARDGSLEVWFASAGGSDIAALVLLRDGDRLYYKYGARTEESPRGASQLLLYSVIAEYAGRATVLDLGRADVRNVGLARFKHELGARPSELPYSFLPKAPQEVSVETLGGWRRAASQIWRCLPRPVARMLGGAIYKYLA